MAAVFVGLAGRGAARRAAAVRLRPGRPRRAIAARLTDGGRTTLTCSNIALPLRGSKVPPGAPLGAGYVPGAPRLGVPALTETDANLGVAYVLGLRRGGATAPPSGMAMGSTRNPALVREGGALIADVLFGNINPPGAFPSPFQLPSSSFHGPRCRARRPSSPTPRDAAGLGNTSPSTTISASSSYIQPLSWGICWGGDLKGQVKVEPRQTLSPGAWR